VDIVVSTVTRSARWLHVLGTPNGPAGYRRAVSPDDPPEHVDRAAADRVRAAVWQRCAGQRGARLDHPFGPDTAVFKVAGKVFALMPERAMPGSVSLKCEPGLAAALRETHRAVTPGYHLNKRHWITIALDGSVEGDLLDDLVDGSYDLVVAKLPKRTRDALASDV
jgi:predicted DNA-binding protein (MmcQ/YjbR family)